MPENLFTDIQKKEITNAIGRAEAITNGEIRVHIEQRCNEDVLDHAAFIFEKLGMHNTKERNGVLFYISIDDHKLAILGDAGINAVVPDGFWDDVISHMVSEFKNGNYTTGLCRAIELAGEQLQKYFPKGDNNPNELSNEISFGKSTKGED